MAKKDLTFKHKRDDASARTKDDRKETKKRGLVSFLSKKSDCTMMDVVWCVKVKYSTRDSVSYNTERKY